MKILVICIAVIILFLATRRGFKRGIAAELKMFVSVAIATLCLLLLLMIKSAVDGHSYATVIVVAAALIVLGIGWKIIKIVSEPLSGFKEIGLVRALDSLLGGVLGFAEGAAIVFIAYEILKATGRFVI